MVHLGVRPRGATPGFNVNGRETFVAGIDWVDDWPVVDPDRFTPSPQTAFIERFEEPTLDGRWISPGGRHRSLVSWCGPGEGVLIAFAGDDDVRPALAVRATDPQWRVDLVVDAERPATLLVYLDSDHFTELRVEQGQAVLDVAVARLRIVAARVALPVPVDVFIATARSLPPTPYPVGGPDRLTFAARSGGIEIEVGTIDGRILTTEVATGFTGRVIRMRAVGASARLREVRYALLPDA